MRDRLRRFEPELAGGWVDLPFSDTEAFEIRLKDLDEILNVFVEAAEAAPELLPLPTLACSGSALRKAHPGGGEEFALAGEQ